MSLSYDVWVQYILPLCDPLRLHVLYCTCKDLHDWVDAHVRASYQKELHSIHVRKDPFTFTKEEYVARYIPVPGLLVFGQFKWSWNDALMANFSLSLLDWLGSERIRRALRWRHAHAGFSLLLRKEKDVVPIIDVLLQHSLIPGHIPKVRGSTMCPFPDHLSESPRNDLLSYFINTGRLDLTDYYFEEDIEKPESEIGNDFWEERLCWAIYSDSISMVALIVELARKNDSHSTLSLSHLIEAILCSDRATEWALKKCILTDDWVQDVYQSMLYLELSTEIMYRADRYLGLIDLGTDYLLESIWRYFSRLGCQLDVEEVQKLRPIFDWGFHEGIFTPSEVNTILVPLFGRHWRNRPEENLEHNTENCTCYVHVFSNFLKTHYGCTV